MVAYSFQRRFVPAIRVGLGQDEHARICGDVHPKRQTVRADRKRHARPGELLQLYCGLRTKRCRLIGVARCTACEPITLDLRGRIMLQGERPMIRARDLDAFAQSDGFVDWNDMCEFWYLFHPDLEEFSGVVIRWQP